MILLILLLFFSCVNGQTAEIIFIVFPFFEELKENYPQAYADIEKQETGCNKSSQVSIGMFFVKRMYGERNDITSI